MNLPLFTIGLVVGVGLGWLLWGAVARDRKWLIGVLDERQRHWFNEYKKADEALHRERLSRYGEGEEWRNQDL